MYYDTNWINMQTDSVILKMCSLDHSHENLQMYLLSVYVCVYTHTISVMCDQV